MTLGMQRSFLANISSVFLMLLFIIIPSIVNATVITRDSVAKGMISDGACFGVSGLVRDGTPDCVTLDFFAVLNRQAPDQEERGIAEFDTSTIMGNLISATLAFRREYIQFKWSENFRTIWTSG